MKRARLILNPVSGNDPSSEQRLAEIATSLEAVDIRADIRFTQPDESPISIAQRAVAEGYDMVVVGGGDGTVSEVAKGLLYQPIPLGILPFGTYNNIARSLNIPNDIATACQVLAQGQIKLIDVGEANDRHVFFEAAGVGLDAALFPLGEEIKDGRWARFIQAFRRAMAYKPQRVRLFLDRPIAEAKLPPVPRYRLRWRGRIATSRELRFAVLLIVIANGPYYGAGFTVAPDACLEDGLLTISVYRNFSKLDLIEHFWSISNGQYRYSPKIETYRVAQVQINSIAQLPVHIDGQPIGTLPVTFKALKRALRVLVPDVAPTS